MVSAGWGAAVVVVVGEEASVGFGLGLRASLSFGWRRGVMVGPNCASRNMQRRAKRSSGVMLACGLRVVGGWECEWGCLLDEPALALVISRQSSPA